MQIAGIPFNVPQEELARAYFYLLENPLDHHFVYKTESPELLDIWVDQIINDRRFSYSWSSKYLAPYLYHIAGNKFTVGETLQKIYNAIKDKTDFYYVLAQIAANSNCPADILRALCCHDSSGVRSGVAGNPNTPPDVLLMMKKDRSPYVKIKLARNPHTPQEVLKHLANSERENVVVAVAENINVCFEILNKIILYSSFIKAKKAAINNPNYPLAKIIDYATDVRNLLYSDAYTLHYDVGVVAIALASSRLPVELANQLLEEMLACQKYIYNLDFFIASVLQHPGIKTELLLAASMHKATEIRQAAQEVLKRKAA
ncbi:hypothetical protein [Neomoorella thermoacetica]|uniref:hypothetical protein n=1 Tax=Neomoorella thermoacetica TaxID=1525 RepID=UPI00084C2283|nr:hypothetical protein [Moorella thermoacetica]